MVPAPAEGRPDETRPMKALAPGSQVSHYRIIEKLGQGGMGVVYKAEDTKLKRTVALKFLPPYLTEEPHARERFVHEAQAASALDHNNICTIHEIDETDDGHTFISMACYEGTTLRERMERGALDLDEVLGIGQQISEGLTKAHGKGIVHRDLKPANIMITDDGVAKIMDFGLAKLAGRTKITRTGTTMGTPAYMSPEQAQGSEVDQRSDIFSLGVILYEMIAGRPPFKGEYEAAVLYSILHDAPEALSDSRPGIPAQLERIVSRALEKDVSKRYQSSAEIAVDLAQLREDTRAGVASKPKRIMSRNRFIISAIAVLAVVVAYIVFLGDGPEDSDQPSEIAREELFTIVVAHFWGATEGAVEEGKVMQALVEGQLRAELSGEDNVQILSDVISRAPRSQEEATTLGKELDAAAIIWGEALSLHGEVEIQPHLTLVKRSMVFWNQAGSDFWNLSIPALRAELSQPGQLELRKSKAEQVTNLGLMAAAYYYGSKDFNKAQAILRRIIPPSSTSLLVEALIEFNSDRRAEAESLCLEAISLDTLDPWAYYTLGLFYSELGRYEEAIPRLERAFALDPNHEESRWQLALAYARKGEGEKALALHQAVVDRNPESSALRVKFGLLYDALHRPDEAIDEFNLAIRLDPDNLLAYRGLGFAYEFNDSLSGAVEAYTKARELATATEDQATMSWFLGRAYWKQDRHNEALTEFHRAIALRPASPHYYFLLVDAYDNLGKGEEGLRIIEEAVEAHPNDPMFHMILGEAYGLLGRPADAFAACKEALRLSPSSGDSYYSVAQAYAEMDSIDQAAPYYKEAARLGIRYLMFPGWPHTMLAKIYLVRGLTQDAEEELLKAIAIDPDNGGAYASLGLTYAYQGRYDEAADQYEKATRIDPDFAYYDIFYALTLHYAGRAKEGRAHLRRLAESFEGDPWEQAVVGFLTGSLDEATLLSLAESEDPTTEREHKCEAYYYVGNAYLLETDADLGSSHPDTTKAQAYLEQCLGTGVWNFHEYHYARIELARLKGEQLQAREPQLEAVGRP